MSSPFTFETPLAKIVVDDDGRVSFNWYGPCLFKDLSVVLSATLKQYFVGDEERTPDELEDGLRCIQNDLVSNSKYEDAAIVRDARQAIKVLAKRNDDYRNTIDRLTAPHRQQVKKEIED
jgi:hypothetical protein